MYNLAREQGEPGNEASTYWSLLQWGHSVNCYESSVYACTMYIHAFSPYI